MTTERGAPVVRKFLKVRDVAELLSVSRATVYRLVEVGRLDQHWIGTSIRISAASFDAYLAALKPQC